MKARINIIAIISVVLFYCTSVIAFAYWEKVQLSDRSNFDVNCEYRAIVSSKLAPLRTKFSKVQSKRIGYLPDSNGKELNVYVMSNNKSILRFETKTGYLIKELIILELEKNCLASALNRSSPNSVHKGVHFE